MISKNIFKNLESKNRFLDIYFDRRFERFFSNHMEIGFLALSRLYINWCSVAFRLINWYSVAFRLINWYSVAFRLLVFQMEICMHGMGGMGHVLLVFGFCCGGRCCMAVVFLAICDRK